MFRTRRILPLAPALAVLLLGIGCDGGSDRINAAELVRAADEICGKERTSFARIQENSPPNAPVAADQTTELIEVTQDANAQLRDLKPPEELQPAYDRYLEARNLALDQMERGRDAAEERNSATYGAAQAAVARDAPERRKLAQALGLKVCSSSGATA
jgi:hypothetical protein